MIERQWNAPSVPSDKTESNVDVPPPPPPRPPPPLEEEVPPSTSIAVTTPGLSQSHPSDDDSDGAAQIHELSADDFNRPRRAAEDRISSGRDQDDTSLRRQIEKMTSRLVESNMENAQLRRDVADLQDRCAKYQEEMKGSKSEVFRNQEDARRKSEQLLIEKNSRRAVEKTCAKLEKRYMAAKSRIVELETAQIRQQVSSSELSKMQKALHDAEVAAAEDRERLKESELSLMERTTELSALKESMASLRSSAALGDFYFTKYAQASRVCEGLEQSAMAAEEQLMRQFEYSKETVKAAEDALFNTGETESLLRRLRDEIAAYRMAVHDLETKLFKSKRDTSVVRQQLKQSQVRAAKFEAFSAEMTKELHGQRRNTSRKQSASSVYTYDGKIINRIIDALTSAATVAKNPAEIAHDWSDPRAAAVIRNLEKELQEKDTRIASLEFQRGLDQEQRRRLEDMNDDICNLVNERKQPSDFVYGDPDPQSLAATAVRDLAAIRFPWRVGQRDSARLDQLRDVSYVVGALETARILPRALVTLQRPTW